jgi:DNA-binding Lrp family transcriptional regulator
MRILRAMGTGPYEHGPRHPRELLASNLAKRVQSSRQTVQTRIARMERDKIIQGYEIFPNLNHLGLAWGIYHWRLSTPEAKQRLYEAIEPVDGINGVFEFVTNDICIEFYWTSPEERARRLRLLSSLAGGANPLTLFSRATPPVHRPLSNLDWRILRALRGSAKRPLSQVARELGVAARTVKRHYEKMASEAAFDVHPIVALENASQSIAVALLFRLHPEAGAKTTQALLREFDRECISSWVPPSIELGDFDMTVYVESTAQISDLRRRALAVRGVASVEALLYQAARINPGWLNEMLDRQIASTASVSKRASAPSPSGQPSPVLATRRSRSRR